MKKVQMCLFAVAAMMSIQSVKAQTADEVIDKYLTALGGKEKILSLKSVKKVGSLNVQGMDVGVTVTRVQGVGSRNDISVPGMGEGFQVVNPMKGWDFMPFMGQASPEEVSVDKLNLLYRCWIYRVHRLITKKKVARLKCQGKKRLKMQNAIN